MHWFCPIITLNNLYTCRFPALENVLSFPATTLDVFFFFCVCVFLVRSIDSPSALKKTKITRERLVGILSERE